MKKFLDSIARFAIRNLFFMVALVLLGAWVFLQNDDEAAPYYADEGIVMSMMAKVAGTSLSANVAFAATEPENRKVIKNASLTIEVDDTDIAKGLAEEKVAELDGVVTRMNAHEVRSGVLAYNLILWIPNRNLEKALEDIAAFGIKKRESFSSNDITAEYTDTENQIKNLEIRRDRLRQLMEFETDNLGDVLQIDRDLSSVQNELENFQRTQNSRDNAVDFSTIELGIQPKPQIGDFSNPADWNMEKTWKNSINDLIGSLQKIVAKVIRMVVYAPIWLPILLLAWFVQKAVRRKMF